MPDKPAPLLRLILLFALLTGCAPAQPVRDAAERYDVLIRNGVVYDGSGGYGAWQIAARYDVLDLSDKALTIPNCEMCGEQKTWLVALNWYPTDYTRVMFNYVNAEIEGGFMNGRNVNNGANIEGFGTRVQVDW